MSPINISAKKVGAILETNNYPRFKLVIGNRKPDICHVNQMRESIKAGLPINHVVTAVQRASHFDILDGQHYFLSCKEEKVPFLFRTIDISRNDDIIDVIQKMNCHQKPWNSMDYLNSMVDRKKLEYIALKDYMTSRKLDNVDTAIILLGKDQSSRSMKIFRLGGYIMGNAKLGDKRINLLNSFAEKLDYAWNRNFVRAVCQLSVMPNYRHQWFIKKLQRRTLKKQASVEYFMEAIRERYNCSSLPDDERI